MEAESGDSSGVGGDAHSAGVSLCGGLDRALIREYGTKIAALHQVVGQAIARGEKCAHLLACSQPRTLTPPADRRVSHTHLQMRRSPLHCALRFARHALRTLSPSHAFCCGPFAH
jgi:hypothetical protein